MSLLRDAQHILQRGAEGAEGWCMRCQMFCGGKHTATGEEIQCNCHDDGAQDESGSKADGGKPGDSHDDAGTGPAEGQAPGEVTAPPPDSAGQPEPPATDEDQPGVPVNAGVVTAVAGEPQP